MRAVIDMPRSMPQLRRNIIALRNKHGWSQSELSRRAGIGQSTISRIESGDHADPGWATIRAIAQALGVDPSEMVGSAEPTAPFVPAAPMPAESSGDLVGFSDVGDLLRLYISSEWFTADAPTGEELRWLAGLGVITWKDAPPTAGTLHALLHAHRLGRI